MNVGGPAVQISTLMRGLLPTHIHQVLVTGQVGEDEEDYLASQGNDLRIIKVPSLGREINTRRDVSALKALASIIQDFEPDIVHTHTAKAGSLGRSAAILTRNRAKRVHTFHGHLLHGYFTPSGTRRVIAVERTLARRTTRLIAVGERVREDLLEVGIGRRGQFSIVPPGLELGPIPAREQARMELGLDPDSSVVCFIGRLTSIKRIDRLIDVARQSQKVIPNVTFLVAGEGTELPLLQQAARDGVQLKPLGWRSDVERILAASDAMVLTSDNEGTPVSLIQAGLAGVPVVSTDVGSVSDVVHAGKSGLLTRPESGPLAEALCSLLSSPMLREGMGAYAQTHYQQRFGKDALVQAHLAVYSEILQ